MRVELSRIIESVYNTILGTYIRIEVLYVFRCIDCIAIFILNPARWSGDTSDGVSIRIAEAR